MVNHTEYKNTNIGVIPNDWECISLYTLGELLSGLTYTPDDVKKYGLLVLRSSNIQNGRLSFEDNVYVNCKIEGNKYVKKGDLLICVRNGSRALIGKCALIDHDYNATFGAFMALFRSQYGEYLYQLFSSNAIQEQINKNCGATINQITSADFKNFLVAFPQRVKERAAIAEALSDVDSLIFSLQKLIEKKKAIKQGAMQEILTGKNRLPGFSGEWKVVRIGETLSIGHGQSQKTVENRFGKYPILATGGCIGYADNFLWDKPSVLIGRKGTIDKPQYADYPFWTIDTLFYTKIFEEYDAKFIFYKFCIIDWQQYNEASGVPSLSAGTIGNLYITVPEKYEQQAIAQILSDMDSEIEQLEKKLAKYQQIKQGMMQELLTGQIRLVDADSKEKPKAQAVQEKQLKPAHNQHFDDAVMIAGIVDAFYSEKYPLGRKKVQKLLYLVRRKEQADTSAFHKKAAGPYADEVRYKGGEPIAQKNRYIQVKKSDKGSSFEKGVKIQQALTYLQEWKKQEDIDWLLSEFQYTGVNELELLATVDMAMCDLYMDGKEVSVTSIKNLIRSSKEWQDKLKKTYFKDADIQRAIKRCQELFEK